MSSPKSSKSRFQVTQSMPTPKAGTKRSRLRISYINPMSVIKTTFILSLAFGLASIMALIMLWSVAKFSGTIDAATGLLTDIFGIGGAGFNIVSLLSLPRIIFIGSVFTVFQVVTWTLLAGIFSVIYNMFAEYVGGWEITLTDDL
jgi:hypothetical protein